VPKHCICAAYDPQSQPRSHTGQTQAQKLDLPARRHPNQRLPLPCLVHFQQKILICTVIVLSNCGKPPMYGVRKRDELCRTLVGPLHRSRLSYRRQAEVHDRLDVANVRDPSLKVPTNLQILSILSFMFDKSTLARYSRHFFLSSSAI
jgi:hypothetical protein